MTSANVSEFRMYDVSRIIFLSLERGRGWWYQYSMYCDYC